MASTSILRRSLAPIATRLARGQRNYHAAVFTAIYNSCVVSFSPVVPNPRYYAKLYKDITSYYPFKLEDEPGIPTVRLTRGVWVEVEAHMPDLVTGKGEDYDLDDDGKKHANKPCIPLVVTYRDVVTFEFSCNAYPDEILIEGLVIKNPYNSKVKETYMGPDFHNLNESLRKSCYKKLERIGIRLWFANFLHE